MEPGNYRAVLEMKGTVACISCTIARHYSIGGFAGLAVQKEHGTGIDFAHHLPGFVYAGDNFCCVQYDRCRPQKYTCHCRHFLGG